MNIKITNIEFDKTTQCRAKIHNDIVDEYTQAMIDGDIFPAIDVYGTHEKCWIADGWHRALAAKQAAKEEIEATLHKGGRSDAVKHALKANAVHGIRRTNADKQRAVKIALQEFGSLSSRAIADLCGVSHTFVDRNKPQVATVATSTITGRDGKSYPATQQEHEPAEVNREQPELTEQSNQSRTAEPEPGKPQPDKEYYENASMALQYAEQAVLQLKRIGDKDPKKAEALRYVKNWINKQI